MKKIQNQRNLSSSEENSSKASFLKYKKPKGSGSVAMSALKSTMVNNNGTEVNITEDTKTDRPPEHQVIKVSNNAEQSDDVSDSAGKVGISAKTRRSRKLPVVKVQSVKEVQVQK